MKTKSSLSKPAVRFDLLHRNIFGYGLSVGFRHCRSAPELFGDTCTKKAEGVSEQAAPVRISKSAIDQAATFYAASPATKEKL